MYAQPHVADHYAPYGPPKLSGPGIASCVLAGVTAALALLGALVMAAARASSHGGQPTTADWMLGFAMLGSICTGGLLGFAGLVTGIVGVCQTNRRKRVALVGLLANASLLGCILLVMMM